MIASREIGMGTKNKSSSQSRSPWYRRASCFMFWWVLCFFVSTNLIFTCAAFSTLFPYRETQRPGPVHSHCERTVQRGVPVNVCVPIFTLTVTVLSIYVTVSGEIGRAYQQTSGTHRVGPRRRTLSSSHKSSSVQPAGTEN
jgi:hypothetical protein